MASPIFQHGIASGDPLQDRVVLWTRVTTSGSSRVPVRWWVEAFGGRTVARGRAEADPGDDWTVHVDVGGLEPGNRYRFGFEALGESSPVGRTQTLPRTDHGHARFAQVSCAKFNAGYFNAYARLAERDDIDFVLHLGDYIYEASETPPASQTPGADIGRPFDPHHECKLLQDYRGRYAQYRTDPDLQRLHAAQPFIATLDDHELADGAWRDGASEHRAERDGAWAARRAAAFRARWEWLPARPPDPADPERVFRTVSLGSLADILLLDTRTRRDEPVPPPAMHDGARSALGRQQRDWLLAELSSSTARWRLVANPSVIARTWNDDLSESVKHALVKVKLIDSDRSGPDWDQWDGYPAERENLLRFLRRQQIGNVVMLSGDVHVAMVNELRDDESAGRPVAIEFVNSSLTSQNLDDKMGWEPQTASAAIHEAFCARMPHVRWCDFDSHGYTIVDVTSERVAADWWAVDTILRPSIGESLVASWTVPSGEPSVIPTAEFEARLPTP